VCSCRQARIPTIGLARALVLVLALGGKIFARRVLRLVQVDVTKYRPSPIVGQKFSCFTSWNAPPKQTIGNSWNPTHGSALDIGAEGGNGTCRHHAFCGERI
jgi:hypothetical protein